MEAEVKRRKRRVVLVALAACLVVAGIGGTLAWFSAQSQLTNTFTVGNITPPTTDPNNPDQPDVPFPTDPDTDPRIDGNLYEPHWVKDSAIAPNASVAKDRLPRTRSKDSRLNTRRACSPTRETVLLTKAERTSPCLIRSRLGLLPLKMLGR